MNLSPVRPMNAISRIWLNRSPGVVATLLISALMIALAFALKPGRMGDGQYYFAMLEGLANHLSPAITDEVAQVVLARTGLNTQTGMVLQGIDGNLYAWHFWAYSLICVPAYWLLKILDLDTLQAFQLTNAALIIWTCSYLLLRSGLNRAVSGFIVGGFLLSTATLYFQWTHPEVFTASLLLLACVHAVRRHYSMAALLAAVASFQNPSASFLIFPLALAHLAELRHIALFSKASLLRFFRMFCAASLTLWPYLWSLYQFRVLNPIAASGHYIAYSDINLPRFLSFIFDLNQGLIVGMPLLVWAFPLALVARLLHERCIRLRQEDFLLVAFVLMVLPTLAQSNWNAGQSVFLRYAAWAGMPLLVWTGVTLGNAASLMGWRLAVIPAMTLQVALLVYSGGAYAKRHPSYVRLMPWVMPLWEINPHLYHPLPEIFRERVLRRDGASDSPVVLHDKQGAILRVLTRQSTFEREQEQICGAGQSLMPSDERSSSTLHRQVTEHGQTYLTGRLACSTLLPLELTVPFRTRREIQLLSGWSQPESWGVWNDGATASLRLNVPSAEGTVLVTLRGWIFVNEQHPEQTVSLFVNDEMLQQTTVRWPEATLELSGRVRLDDSVLSLQFAAPVSPFALGMSSDARQLAFGLQTIRIEQLP